MDDSLKLESLSLVRRNFGLLDVQNMIKDHIKKHDDSMSSMFEVQHSYIDLRHIYLNTVRQRMNL